MFDLLQKDPSVCNCMCHKKGVIMMHIQACCSKCEDCGKNIKSMRNHQKYCKSPKQFILRLTSDDSVECDSFSEACELGSFENTEFDVLDDEYKIFKKDKKKSFVSVFVGTFLGSFPIFMIIFVSFYNGISNNDYSLLLIPLVSCLLSILNFEFRKRKHDEYIVNFEKYLNKLSSINTSDFSEYENQHYREKLGSAYEKLRYSRLEAYDGYFSKWLRMDHRESNLKDLLSSVSDIYEYFVEAPKSEYSFKRVLEKYQKNFHDSLKAHDITIDLKDKKGVNSSILNIFKKNNGYSIMSLFLNIEIENYYKINRVAILTVIILFGSLFYFSNIMSALILSGIFAYFITKTLGSFYKKLEKVKDKSMNEFFIINAVNIQAFLIQNKIDLNSLSIKGKRYVFSDSSHCEKFYNTLKKKEDSIKYTDGICLLKRIRLSVKAEEKQLNNNEMVNEVPVSLD